MNQMNISCAGEQLTLLADKAVFWERTKTLIIADPHFGKAATFRSAGIPVPEDITSVDLERLQKLLSQTGSERLFILGDFFHARSGRADETMGTIQSWCFQNRNLEIHLVAGNHDRHAGQPPEDWGVHFFAEGFSEAPFYFSHEPGIRENSCTIAGHIHPAISIRMAAGANLRFPCFVFGERGAILPAFGSFTGTHPIQPNAKDRIFAIEDNGLMEIPAMIVARASRP